MQRILGYMRRAVSEFDLISDGDRIAVGVSGGKDSMVLLKGLALLRNFIGIDYSLTAITLDPCFGGKEGDYSAVARLCEECGVPFILEKTHIGEIVFDVRHEEHPCSLCARMRRGALHNEALKAGCNKVALGHHYNDAVETFIMNLFVEGRIGCFSPKSFLGRKQITVIRLYLRRKARFPAPLEEPESKSSSLPVPPTETPCVRKRRNFCGSANASTGALPTEFSEQCAAPV